MSHYNDVLEELKNKKEKLASEYIAKMYRILRDEEHRPPEECRAKIESDCSDIWPEDTISRYLPIEAKNTAKRSWNWQKEEGEGGDDKGSQSSGC